MVLFIGEKPVLGRAVAEALPGTGEEKGGVIRKGENVVTWCYGHLLALKEPQDYSEKYKKWNLGDLPVFFRDWENKTMEDTKERVARIGDLLKEADTAVNCGDTDEEGQLLVDELLRWHGFQGRVLRLDTANTTKEGLQKALQRMEDNRLHENKGWSAYAREVSDMVFGINFTRYYTLLNGNCYPPLTVGRVQTPTLGLVVNRDRLIESHQKTFYYEMTGSMEVSGKKVTVRYIPAMENPDLADGRFPERKPLEETAAALDGTQLNAVVEKKTVTENPPLPFNLTELNRYCGKKWGYNPDKVMEITQKLREDYRAITYNRSDCRYLSMEHHREAACTVPAVCRNLSMDALQFDTGITSRCFNDANITAHFAIIPTNEKTDMENLTVEQKNVYDIICRYYLAQFLPPAEKEKTILTAKTPDGGMLRAAASRTIKKGFYAVLETAGGEESLEEEAERTKETEDDACTAELEEGSHTGRFTSPKISRKETKPPERYTQTSLYTDMTAISKYVEDEGMKKLLLEKDSGKKGENGSIGTSATRAEIIKKLLKAGYLCETVQGKKKVLLSTDKGREFYDMLPDAIKKADVTARWWVIQEEIKNGEKKPDALIESVLDTVKNVIREGTDIRIASAGSRKNARPAVCKCPLCGSDVLEGEKSYFCVSYRTCGLEGLWKSACWTEITKQDAVKLLAGETVSKKAKTRDGKSYHKKIYYDFTEKKIKEKKQ